MPHFWPLVKNDQITKLFLVAYVLSDSKHIFLKCLGGKEGVGTSQLNFKGKELQNDPKKFKPHIHAAI